MKPDAIIANLTLITCPTSPRLSPFRLGLLLIALGALCIVKHRLASFRDQAKLSQQYRLSMTTIGCQLPSWPFKFDYS